MITVQWLKYWVNKLSAAGWSVRSDVSSQMVCFEFRSPQGRLWRGHYHPDAREAYCNALAQVVQHFTELPR